MMLARPSANVPVRTSRHAKQETIDIPEASLGIIDSVSHKDCAGSKKPVAVFKPVGRKRVFVPDPVHVFAPAEIVQYSGNGKVLVQITLPKTWDSTTVTSKQTTKATKKRPPSSALKDKSKHWFATSELLYQNEKSSHDMQQLVHLNAATMMYNLKERHANSKPYTDCLNVLVAMNPFFRPPNLYSHATQIQYADALVWNRSKRIKRPPPHVYQVSSDAYHALLHPSPRRNQSILVSGESGAGKSETVKLALNHLAMMEHSKASSVPESRTVQRILESSPILEAFGNAKTLRNDNSSRFGKFIQLQFDVAGDIPRLMGSKLLTYLLEKSRAIGYNPGERSYHIFYQMLSAPKDVRSRIWPNSKELPTVDSFCYLAKNGTDAQHSGDDSSWETTRTALSAFDITADNGSLVDLLRALAIVLQLGNLQISGEDQATIGARNELETLSSMVGIDASALEQGLTVRIMKTAFDEVAVPLRPSVARDGCDALAKEMYARIFDRLVTRINSFTESNDDSYGTISILDIFGFEKFAVNRFEQLCINYANERLQFQYISNFGIVPEEFKGLGTGSFDLKELDNSSVLALLDDKNGLLDALNEECILPNGSDEGYVLRIKRAHGRHMKLVDERLHRKTEFGVEHFADRVVYDATSFLDRNNDTLPDGLMECIANSSNTVLREEFAALLAERQATAAAQGGGRRKRKSHTTVVQKFRVQLQNLIQSMEETDTRFIRCIKPNETMAPKITDHFSTLRQLKCAGLVAAIDVSRYRDLQVGRLVKTKAAVKIQSHSRRMGACRRVDSIRKTRAAISIQAEARRFLVTTTILLLRREKAATNIQKIVRKQQAITKVHGMRLHLAATRIQSTIRVFQACKIFHSKRRLHCAIRVQTYMRRYWAIQESRKLSLERSAAILIQSHVRRRKWTKIFVATRRVRAVTVIQKNVRRRKAVMLVSEMRLARASAVVIQCQVRCHQARGAVEEIKRQKATATIQTCFRRYYASCRVLGIRRQRAAIFIQSFWRYLRTVRRIAAMHGAATIIQSNSRRMSASALVVAKRKTGAALRIQTWLRQCIAVRFVQQRRLEQSAVMLVQRQVRMYQAKKWVEMRQFHIAASVIQALVRCRLAARVGAATFIQRQWIVYTSQKMHRILIATVLIQTIGRMYAAKNRGKRLRKIRAVAVIQRRFRALLATKHEAAATLQRWWRYYIKRQLQQAVGAATLIQAVGRRYNAKGTIGRQRQIQAARIIQTGVRSRIAMKHKAATILRIHWIERRTQQRLKMRRQNHAIRLIQDQRCRRLATKHSERLRLRSNNSNTSFTSTVGERCDSFQDLEEAITLLEDYEEGKAGCATSSPCTAVLVATLNPPKMEKGVCKAINLLESYEERKTGCSTGSPYTAVPVATDPPKMENGVCEAINLLEDCKEGCSTSSPCAALLVATSDPPKMENDVCNLSHPTTETPRAFNDSSPTKTQDVEATTFHEKRANTRPRWFRFINLTSSCYSADLAVSGTETKGGTDSINADERRQTFN